jgi:hypothetical protein
MTLPAAADREGCAVLELPVSAPGVAVAEAIVGEEALKVLERDAEARRRAADWMRRAHDHGWVVVESQTRARHNRICRVVVPAVAGSNSVAHP